MCKFRGTIFNLGRRTLPALDYMRTDKGLPAVMLIRREHVYFADSVLWWLKQPPQTG